MLNDFISSRIAALDDGSGIKVIYDKAGLGVEFRRLSEDLGWGGVLGGGWEDLGSGSEYRGPESNPLGSPNIGSIAFPIDK